MKDTEKRPGLMRVLAWVLVITCLLSNLPVSVFATADGVAAPTTDATEQTIFGDDVPATASLKTMITPPAGALGSPYSLTPQSNEDIDLSTFNGDLIVYNDIYYVDATGTITANASAQFSLTGTAVHSVQIGDSPVEGDPITSPVERDIPLILKTVTMGEGCVFAVKPVNYGTNTVKISVSEDSSIHTLTVEANAKLELTLNAPLSIDALNLGDGSVLTVSTNGYELTLGSLSGSGDVTISGSGSVNTGSIRVRNLSVSSASITASSIKTTADLTLNGASLNVENGMITANGDISAAGTNVYGASVFGFDSGAAGVRTLTLDGGSFQEVGVVGAAQDCGAVVRFQILNGLSSSTGNTSYIRDYSITYLSGGIVLAPEADWPVYYRVQHIGNYDGAASFLGSINAGGDYSSAASVGLPQYTEPGYAHTGWKLSGGETTITAVTDQTCDLELTAVLAAGSVTWQTDLGFDPGETTNDKNSEGKFPQRTQTAVNQMGESITLVEPARFGYKFIGWKITSGSNAGKLVAAGSYKFAFNDLNVLEDGTYVLTLEAQWEAATFPIRLQLRADLLDYTEISVDGGGTWMNIGDFADKFSTVTFDSSDNTFSFTQYIRYYQELGAYFADFLNGFPVLRDNREGDPLRQQFNGWQTSNGTAAGEIALFSLDGGFLDNRQAEQTLAEYQSSLVAKPITLQPSWGTMDYTLTTDIMAGWDIYVDGKAVTPNEKGEITVPQGSTVTYRCAADSSTGFAMWSVSRMDGKGYAAVTERTFSAGEPYLYYDFTMPESDIIAANVRSTDGSNHGTLLAGYSTDGVLWIDLSKSPVTFSNTVSHNNHTYFGFWYKADIERMTPWFTDSQKGNFYPWDITEDFFVTSNSQPTQNKLTLVNAMKVHLKDCNLVPTDDYMTNAVGTKLGGVDLEQAVRFREGFSYTEIGNGVNNSITLGDCGNIVIDNAVSTNYTTELYFSGENTVGAIVQDHLRTSSDYLNDLNLHGEDAGSVNLGTVVGAFKTVVKDLTVNGNDDGFDYLIYSTYSNTVLGKGAHINAPEKTVHTTSIFQSGDDSSVDVKNLFAGQRFIFAGSAYVRTRGYMIYGAIPFTLQQSASLVVDGDLLSTYQTYQDSHYGTIDTTGYLIVKGNRCDLSAVDLKNGTVICNALVLGRKFDLGGGIVLANQIMSSPALWPRYDVNQGKILYNYKPSYAKAADANGDNSPFLVYPQSTGNYTYSFSGGDIYLLGYYNAQDGVYDTSVQAVSAGNPVAPLVYSLLDENGDLRTGASLDAGQLLGAVNAAAELYEDNACVVLGSSTFTGESSIVRDVRISGSNIYASGNVTFYNDTTVTGGTIHCGGSFGTKGDLTISDGDITAAEVGNAYNLRSTTVDGFSQWKHTVISGGTIRADNVGSLSKDHPDGTTPRGTVVIENASGIQAGTKLTSDVCINYISGSQFDLTGVIYPESLRFTGTWVDGSTEMTDVQWSTDPLTFDNPRLAGDGEDTGLWKLGSVNGPTITGIAANGCVLDESGAATETQCCGEAYLLLYAVKTEYDLNILEGAGYLSGVTINGLPVSDLTQTVAAQVGSQMVLSLNDAYMASERTVVWTRDGNGSVRNVLTDGSVSGNTITFEMPVGDVEVFITNEMTLDLGVYGISLTGDGFRTEYGASRDDSAFHYSGDVKILQSDVGDTIYVAGHGTYPIQREEDGASYATSPNCVNYFTGNRVLFTADFDNTVGGRKVTLTQVLQDGTPLDSGVVLDVGAKVVLDIVGPVQVHMVQVPDGSVFTARGANGSDADVLHLYPSTGAFSDRNNALVGNYYGKAGVMTLENLTIALRTASGGYVGYSAQACGSLIYRNCKLSRDKWMNSRLGQNLESVTIDNCDFSISASETFPGAVFSNCRNVKLINGTKITHITAGGTMQASNPFYSGITGELLIQDSALSIVAKSLTESTTENQAVTALAPVVRLAGNAAFNTGNRLRLRSLVLQDSATMNVGSGNGGYLFCENVQVGGSAVLNAGGVVVAGFYDAKYGEILTENDFQNIMAAGLGILDGNSFTGLTINDNAQVNAGFVGGDVNAKVTVNGGTLNADRIGTYGALLGYARYVPKVGEAFYYEYAKIPVSATVNVNGGAVNVRDGGYLGGMNATVNVKGGLVNLGENATLGMTDVQKETMENAASQAGSVVENASAVNISAGVVSAENGSISAPYGNVTVSGTDTSVNVRDLLAQNGSISVSHTGEALLNPYAGQKDHTKVGVSVGNRLEAEEISILDGAVVYAKYAYACAGAGQTGFLCVGGSGEPAYLYVGSAYGTSGDGTASVKVADDGSKIYGTRQFVILYHLSEDALNDPDNPQAFEYKEGYITLKDPVRYGYQFDGWYTTSDYSGERIDKLTTAVQRDHEVWAKWTLKTVEFRITVSQADIPSINLADEYLEAYGDYDGATNVFTFKDTVSIGYLQRIIGTEVGQLSAEKYPLKSYTITQFRVNDPEVGVDVYLDSGSSVVTSELLDAYAAKGGKPLNISAAACVKSRVSLTLDMNLSEKNRPVDAVFNYDETNKPAEVTATKITSHVDIGKTMSDAAGFVVDGSLLAPTAPGYTFTGWYDNQDWGDNTGNEAALSIPVKQGMVDHYYAHWQPNTYGITFDSDGGRTTMTDGEPSGTEAGTLSGTVVYDTVLDGNLDFDTEAKNLPYAWKEGYVFLGWSYDGEHIIDTETEFNLTDIPTVDLNVGEDDAAVTLTALYRPVEITYHTAGGQWNNGYTGETFTAKDLAYGDPLAGYVVDGGSYQIVSTSADEFAQNNGQYVENDYRGSIQRKGYTFTGWFDADNQEIQTVPAYKDVELFAGWSANTYQLQLNHAGSSSYAKYAPEDEVGSATVTVGKEISDQSNWPSRNSWYAYNSDLADATEDAKRFLLGFTFDSFDPGCTTEGSEGYQTYLDYAKTVTLLFNRNCVLSNAEKETSGSVFFLPSDKEYGTESLVVGTTAVPDYPTGSTIPMYAVYRERSLVFVEYVQTDDGVERTVMYSAPWNTWSDYPTTGYPNAGRQEALRQQGYILTSWRVNGMDITAPVYPDSETDYLSQVAMYKQKAQELGTYDIMVYTVYAAQAVVKDAVLRANANPTATTNSFYVYTLPGSMQSGTLNYQLSDLNGLKVVDIGNLNQYDRDSANDTVAIRAELFQPGNTTPVETVWLKDNAVVQGTKAAAAGYQIKLTLFHSNVMSAEREYPVVLKVGFNEQALEEQHITFAPLKLVLTPSVFRVVYNTVIPEGVTVSDWMSFDPDTGGRIMDVPYGGNVLAQDAVPVIKGYSATGGWTSGEYTVDYGGKLDYPVTVSDHGKITLATTWQINRHSLTADASFILKNWEITYGTDRLTDEGAEVAYGTQITFKPVGTQVPAYVLLNIGGETVRLDMYEEATANADGSYSFTMPDASVQVSFQNTVTLYLEDGSIAIDPTSYTQNGVTVPWPGQFIIRQNENDDTSNATTNTISLSGALGHRSVTLKELNISAEDSVVLAPGCTGVDLFINGTVTARNILVPDTASVLVGNTSSDKSQLNLSPASGAAAIGGKNGANGAIELFNLRVEMELSAPSDASGIGSGDQTSGGSAIVIRNGCVITVKETSTASDIYHGVWIGGNGVESVTLKDASLVKSADSQTMIGPKVLEGKKVTLTNTTIGSNAEPVTDPIHANETLTISGSKIYQSLDNGVAIGTEAGGTVLVTDSQIQAYVQNGSELYTGTLKINDAKSDVMIANTQIVETSNGDITVSDTAVLQGDNSHPHVGGYLLINELGGTTASLTVNSIAAGESITTKVPALKDVSINADTQINLMTDMRIDGTVDIAGGSTLLVNADSRKVDLDKTSSFTDNDGTYQQIGGNLNANEVACSQLDITLENVKTTATTLIAENLTLIGGSITADAVGSNGNDGVTWVKIDGTRIDADTVGALGTQNETFTFVELKNQPQINAELVQDHFRLEYLLNDSNYSVSGLDTVLRTRTAPDNTVTVKPAIPDNPTYLATGSDSYFACWYVIDNAGVKCALSTDEEAGFEKSLASLLPEHIGWSEPVSADGTRTLKVYGNMQIHGNGVIAQGRKLNPFDAQDTAVSVAGDDAWTAKFTVTGAVPNTSYQLSLDAPLPAGVELTLWRMNGGVPEFYWYRSLGTETVIPFNAFTRMGGTGKAQFAANSAVNVLYLAAEFNGTAATSGTYKVKLQLSTADNATMDIAEVDYTLTNAPGAVLQAANDTVTVEWSADQRLSGQELYLVAELTRNGQKADVPYDAVIMLDSMEGSWISGNWAVFRLGDAGQALNSSYSLLTAGLTTGEYTVTWRLAASGMGAANALGKKLAAPASVALTVSEATLPSMDVTSFTVDGVASSGRVLTQGQAHTITFTLAANSDVDVTTEQQSQFLANFVQTDAITCSKNGDTVTASFPDSVTAGTYRIRFSLAGTDASSADDVYVTFIVR